MTSPPAPSFAPPASRCGAFPLLLQEARSTQDRSRWPQPPIGHGRPAMLIPGFLAGDASLARMALWLRDGGWATVRPGIRANVECMEPAVGALEKRLEAAVEGSGRRALVVGQSRGGTFGHVLAVRRPDLVEALVTLGSPVLDQSATDSITHWVVEVVAALGSRGVPGLFTHDCSTGECCAVSRRELAAPVSNDVRYIAFYSRRDAVVSWEACLAPEAEPVEVTGTHVGMGVSLDVWRRIAELLREPA
jgi:triacylglycerol lipase